MADTADLAGYRVRSDSNIVTAAAANDYDDDAGGARQSSGSDSPRVPASRTCPKKVYLLFLGMGLATLLPWNLFISASEFFRYQFAGSPHEDTFQNSFSVVHMVLNFASNLYAMATVTKVNPNSRIIYGLVANTIVYVVGAVMPYMSEYRGSVSFYIALAQLAIGAISSGMLVNSLFALTSHFPSFNSEGVLSGQAAAGVLATAAQLVTAYSVSPTGHNLDSASRQLATKPSTDGLITRTVAYFIFATALNLLLTVVFWYVRHDPYYQSRSKLAFRSEDLSYDSDQDSEILFAALSTPVPTLPSFSSFKRTFSQISDYTYVIIADFTVTLSLFPSVTAMVTSTSGFKLLTEWHFFLYNIGDFLGRRFAPSIPVTQASTLMLLALTRLLFIPAFFVCNVSFSVWYNWIESDTIFLCLVCIFGFSNGFLSTRAAMTAPKLADQPTIAGSIVAISISSGLALGSMFSWPLRSAGCLCSPF
ncbi:nucleoside transporter-domain-containing protein [Coemansia spiralis]|nr:nucleoside transporter-domain-containing protein [Coemansia spiralis]